MLGFRAEYSLSTKSIRSGDKNRTNRMFRRRIYAQGFTIFAMVLGSAYWESDRVKRGEYNDLVEDRKKKDQHELWIKELEVREEEEKELRKMRDRLMSGRAAERQDLGESERRAVERQTKKSVGQEKGGFGEVKSVLEESESRRAGGVLAAATALWDRRR